MNARDKLNGLHLKGSVLVAGAIGAAAGSFPVFVVTLAGLIIAHVLAGSIRPGKNQRR